MQIEGTRQAFEKLISERGVYKRLGVERSTVSTWKIYLREGKSISLDKMEEMLIKGGATVAHDKVWEVPAFRIKMEAFQKELRTKGLGDSITVDLSGDIFETVVSNNLMDHATKIDCIVSMDDLQRPVVKYYFKPKK